MERWLEFDFLPTPRAQLGESPVWSADDDSVWWVDITGRRVLRTDLSGGRTQSWQAPEMAGMVTRCARGGAVVGMESGLFHLDPETGRFRRIATLEERDIRFNDAAVDATGRLWAATMDLDHRRPVGVLYAIDPDLTMRTAATGFFIPNGLAVDEERERIYFSDSHPDRQTVWVADIDLAGGRMGPARIFARFETMDGRPDGAAVDAEGNYWIAGVGGGALHAFSPGGEHLAAYRVPVDSPTKIAFGGRDMNRLFLTSKADDGRGGRLAVATTQTRGRAGFFFAGGPETPAAAERQEQENGLGRDDSKNL